MKRLISAALALTLLGATAASAQPYNRGGGHYRGHHGGRGDGAAILGLGIGLLALGAIASSSQGDRYNDRYYDSYDYGPPPPPPPRYRQRYGYDGYGYRY
jgi:hypothetical protein